MFRSFFSTRLGSLSGAPSIRRLKTYSAQTGYAYQYFYEGYRSYRKARAETGTEFVFRVWAGRKSGIVVRVLLADDAVHAWEQAHTRALTATERYAIAKMALFQAFDERATPALLKQDVCVRLADVDAILETLGIEPEE
ncbi:MAG: hypothetical protein LAP40_05065 [Acidobacteriia bacterium]|nr:hypothetical protein [Terriglobia bacterium]